MLIGSCILQIITDLSNQFFIILVGISIFFELIGIALDKKNNK